MVIINFTGSLSSGQMISSMVVDGESVCLGREINFTCQTSGSQSIAWTSSQYIDPDGSRLDFAQFNTVGQTKPSPINPNTTATLINKTNETGIDVLLSELRIIIIPQFDTFSVSCSRDNGIETTISLRLLGKFV